jgi:glycosyltransferase involved in cell wall biosynthesis
MNVLHVLTTIDPAGAGPVEAARLLCLSSRPDYRAEVLCLDSDSRSWASSWPVPVHAVGHSSTYKRYSRALVPWLVGNSFRFDAVVVHGVWGYHLVGVHRALSETDIPYFVILHGMLNPWFKRTYPLKHIKKWAAWQTMTGRALSGATAILYLCEEERRLARSNFDIDCSSEAFVPLGTPICRVGPSLFLDHFPRLRGKRIVLFLGRVCYMKGCDLLIEAFAGAARSSTDAQLVMCGPDQEGLQAKLQRVAHRLGISERVTWTGPLYGTAKWSALAAADLFALPSRCETFPISVIEALASATPVLVTRDINIYPEIEAGGAGLICDSTVGSIRNALVEWFARGGDAREALQTRARECHAHYFTLDQAIEKHIAAIATHCRPYSQPDELERQVSTCTD